MTSSLLPVTQTWPDDLAALYKARGYWRGETFPAMLRRIGAQHGDRIAFSEGARQESYRDFAARAQAFGAGLLERGYAPGDRVLIQLGNSIAFFHAAFGLFAAGLVPVYALPAHRRTEIAHLLRKSQAVAMITHDRLDGFDHAGLAAQMLEEIPGLRDAFIVGEAGALTGFDSIAGDPATLPEDPDPQSVAFLQISGGSTGMSKLIPRTHDDYIYSLWASNEICGVTEDSVYGAVLPVAHNFTMSSPGCYGALYAGARVVLFPSPVPDAAFPLIRQEGVTITGLVPPLALLWLDAAEKAGGARTARDLASLKVLLVGGAKFLPESARRVKPVLGCTLQQVFGMAEGLVNYTRLDDDEATITQTQGRPISPDDEVRVLDDAGNPVADGTPGHLLTRGPYTIRGYHDEPAANERSFEDGWYRTGDIVIRHPSGHLTVQGRAGDHINRAGEKISAEEVEDHLVAHPAVLDAVVVSIPDAKLGERIAAFILPKEGQALRAVDIRKFMRSRQVAPFKTPDEIRFVTGFGTTAVGKISRKTLRAELREEVLKAEAAEARKTEEEKI
ncbi:(2,3-dihydroxybenzoyl)adenylate synthase [Pseudooceanicola sp. HF7]|uniref:(2,3-dihydroxybenzoyl)adenylate synthase n=1 Tax=Pseudooceanicola sp. HF7 TaxID=2721560 RepID=UPI00143134C1|nr:AMP-binding protein [Pseudooceanicola sp. HF7]NIZ10888.1 AMP-binding protein [Pseudooceanicola sp. HF7]